MRGGRLKSSYLTCILSSVLPFIGLSATPESPPLKRETYKSPCLAVTDINAIQGKPIIERIAESAIPLPEFEAVRLLSDHGLIGTPWSEEAFRNIYHRDRQRTWSNDFSLSDDHLSISELEQSDYRSQINYLKHILKDKNYAVEFVQDWFKLTLELLPYDLKLPLKTALQQVSLTSFEHPLVKGYLSVIENTLFQLNHFESAIQVPNGLSIQPNAFLKERRGNYLKYLMANYLRGYKRPKKDAVIGFTFLGTIGGAIFALYNLMHTHSDELGEVWNLAYGAGIGFSLPHTPFRNSITFFEKTSTLTKTLYGNLRQLLRRKSTALPIDQNITAVPLRIFSPIEYQRDRNTRHWIINNTNASKSDSQPFEYRDPKVREDENLRREAMAPSIARIFISSGKSQEILKTVERGNFKQKKIAIMYLGYIEQAEIYKMLADLKEIEAKINFDRSWSYRMDTYKELQVWATELRQTVSNATSSSVEMRELEKLSVADLTRAKAELRDMFREKIEALWLHETTGAIDFSAVDAKLDELELSARTLTQVRPAIPPLEAELQEVYRQTTDAEQLKYLSEVLDRLQLLQATLKNQHILNMEMAIKAIRGQRNRTFNHYTRLSNRAAVPKPIADILNRLDIMVSNIDSLTALTPFDEFIDALKRIQALHLRMGEL